MSWYFEMILQSFSSFDIWEELGSLEVDLADPNVVKITEGALLKKTHEFALFRSSIVQWCWQLLWFWLFLNFRVSLLRELLFLNNSTFSLFLSFLINLQVSEEGDVLDKAFENSELDSSMIFGDESEVSVYFIITSKSVLIILTWFISDLLWCNIFHFIFF